MSERGFLAVDADALRAAVEADLAAARTLPAGSPPFTLLSWAQSLDGSAASAPGVRTALSGEAALDLVHAVRACCDAILVGLGTVLADDPSLRATRAGGPDPLPVVLDTRLSIPEGARLVGRGAVLLHAADPEGRAARLAALGARPVRVAGGGNGVDPAAALGALAALGVRSLMVEGGPRVHAAFLGSGLAARLLLDLAPLLLGGYPSVGAALPGGVRLADALVAPWGPDGAGGHRDLFVYGTPVTEGSSRP